VSTPLSRDEINRYSRHLLIPEVGLEGQRRLREARVLCAGAGGLGSPAALYLAAAGVGTLGLVDHDRVDFSNLQRQVLHSTPDIGRPKLESACERLHALNPEVTLRAHNALLTSANALEILGQYDVIVDGTDNFPTRYLINDACVLLGKPNMYGSVYRFDGQASVFAAKSGPCYRCLFPEPPPPGLVPSCAEGGVLGVLPGIVGTVQAAEAIKWIIGAGESLVGRVLLVDGLRMRFREITLRKDPDCPVCGTHPTVRALIDYDEFCGVTAADAGPTEFDLGPLEVRRLLDSPAPPQLVDVREPPEGQINRIEGARLIPLGELPSRLGEIDQTRDVVAYCRVGVRSAHAVQLLRAAGLRAWNLAGGIVRWIDDIDPSQPRY
jgi:molybdopterin/thiamine biosynthesis adenylyltransferase/rhodanese-related sulfurtransferase